jgi:hypothetical protein
MLAIAPHPSYNLPMTFPSITDDGSSTKVVGERWFDSYWEHIHFLTMDGELPHTNGLWLAYSKFVSAMLRAHGHIP